MLSKEYPNSARFAHFHPRSFVIRLAGYVGATATTALTVCQYTENYSGWIMLIYSALAFAICIFEFVAVHDAKKYYADKNYLYASLYLIAGIGAFIFDISGTIGYMSSSVTKAIQEEKLSGEVLDSERNLSELRKNQVIGIQGDNQSIQSINNDFLLRGKPSKAKENIYAMKSNQNLISSIVKQEEAANSKRREIFGMIKSVPMLCFYKSVSNLFGFDVEDVKKWFELLAATTASLVSILMSGYKSKEEISEEAQLYEIRIKEKELRNKMRMASLNKMIIDFDIPPDGTDPTSKRPSLDKKEPTDKESSLVQAPSFAKVNPSPNAVLDLVMQEEESDCGLSCLAMIIGTNNRTAKKMYPYSYSEKGIFRSDLLKFLDEKNIPYSVKPENFESLSKCAGDDNVILASVVVKGANGLPGLHLIMFEKGVVYCPSRGYMSEEEAFARFFSINDFYVIKCADLPRQAVVVESVTTENEVQKSSNVAPEDVASDVPKQVHKENVHLLENKGSVGVSLQKKLAEPVSQRKRQNDSADTGTEKGKNLRYRALVAKIRSGIKPTIRNIRKYAECNQETAEKYREKMLKSNVIMVDGNGSHILKPKLKSVK